MHNWENNQIEYSEGISGHHRLVSKTIGFLNSKGGKFYIGISDVTKKPVGKRFTQRDEEKVVSILTSSILPIPVFDVKIHSDSLGNTIVVVTILEGPDPPYYKKSKGIPNGVYLRIGSCTRRATQEDIARLYMKRQNIGYDEKAITYFSNFKSASIDVLDRPKLEKYIRDVSAGKGVGLQKVTGEHILDVGAATKIEGRLCPTIGGILMFCDTPGRCLSVLSDCYIKGTRFKGNKVTDEIIDQKEITGTLDSQIEKGFNFVKAHLNLGGIIKGVRRKDILEIPEFVVRELIVNAVAHRDYSISGATINIAIFDDRIEFFSPGGLPSGVTPENIRDKSVIRNRIIADCLYHMKFIERFGTGWDRIITNMKEYNLPIPKIEDSGTSVKVIVRRPVIYEPVKIRKMGGMSKKERIVLVNLEVGKKYTLKQIVRLMESSSENATKRLLNKLKRKGLLEVNYKGKGEIEKL